jgi:hypothetical protein
VLIVRLLLQSNAGELARLGLRVGARGKAGSEAVAR